MPQEERKLAQNEEIPSFMAGLATADVTGKRKWVYPKKPRGKFTRYRDLVSYLLLLFLFICPFIKVNGNPLFLFDIINRQFYLFGSYFSPTDFYLFAIGLVTTLVFIILFTVIYGRIFCGWICPQTIFMEHVFRKIEYWIEGDRNSQIRLDKQKWDSEKIRKKLSKWIIFTIISFLISNLLFSYIIGIEQLKKWILEGPIENIGPFIGLFIFSILFYFVFAWFREQACTFVCPYGRLQGVLIDKQTISISYDFVRGERSQGRAKWKKNQDRKALGIGDCIDCHQCVVVCPTGIDIRNGNQMDCINCTACIDACDEVMTKINYPTGLIRYASEEMIEKRTPFKFTARVIAYTFVLLLLIGITVSLLFVRANIETKFLKEVGTQFSLKEGIITDDYQFIFINKTNEIKKLKLRILSPENATITLLGYGDEISIKPKQTIKGGAKISIPENKVNSTKEEIIIGTFDENGNKLDEYKTNFIGPSKIIF